MWPNLNINCGEVMRSQKSKRDAQRCFWKKKVSGSRVSRESTGPMWREMLRLSSKKGSRGGEVGTGFSGTTGVRWQSSLPLGERRGGAEGVSSVSA